MRCEGCADYTGSHTRAQAKALSRKRAAAVCARLARTNPGLKVSTVQLRTAPSGGRRGHSRRPAPQPPRRRPDDGHAGPAAAAHGARRSRPAVRRAAATRRSPTPTPRRPATAGLRSSATRCSPAAPGRSSPATDSGHLRSMGGETGWIVASSPTCPPGRRSTCASGGEQGRGGLPSNALSAVAYRGRPSAPTGLTVTGGDGALPFSFSAPRWTAVSPSTPARSRTTTAAAGSRSPGAERLRGLVTQHDLPTARRTGCRCAPSTRTARARPRPARRSSRRSRVLRRCRAGAVRQLSRALLRRSGLRRWSADRLRAEHRRRGPAGAPFTYAAAASCTAPLDGLTYGHAYEFRVRARDERGRARRPARTCASRSPCRAPRPRWSPPRSAASSRWQFERTGVRRRLGDHGLRGRGGRRCVDVRGAASTAPSG